MGNNSSQYDEGASSQQVHQPVFRPQSEPILSGDKHPGKTNITPKMKQWVKGNNVKCFMVYANGLKISWAEDERHWLFHNIETSDGEITVAILRGVCWLEVHGKLHTSKLTHGVTYQVAFLIMVEETAYGFQVPVNFRLTLPNGSKQEHREEHLSQKPKEEWLRIPIGEFKTSPENQGEIEFSLYEFEGGNQKKGLVIKAVSIEPKM